MLANIFLQNNGVPVHEALVALTIVHVMLFLAWLGVDTGVFYASWRLRRAGLSAETRLELTRVLVFLDRSPRMASLLMVPIALSLAFTGGLGLTGVSDAQMNAIFWPILVLMLLMSWALVRFEREVDAGRTDTPFVRAYRAMVRLIKVGTFIAFMATGIAALAGVEGLWNNDYIAWKAILFACIAAAAQWIEYGFRDFAPAFGDLIANGETPERHRRLDRAIRGAYPPVLTLYALVVTTAILGMASARGGF
jgi:hypothetical protein